MANQFRHWHHQAPLYPNIFRLFVRLLFLLSALGVMTACTSLPVSPYDSTTDKAITRLHKQTAEFFVGVVQAEGCEYDRHLGFYHTSKVSLSGLTVRAKAVAYNDIAVEQLALLVKSFDDLADLHELGCFSSAQVDDLWAAFDLSFSAILKLELAKKYGRW